MLRKPGAGRSRASADTLCQKCLKRGHYSYECKATAQERPYVSRPSRTQQLLNPRLQPRLTTEVPNDLLRKKGVADELLKKKDADRDRDRTSRKRSRSSDSADSIPTISTNRSPSRSPSPPRSPSPRRRRRDAPPKRSRRSVSIHSPPSSADRNRERNTRRRMSSFSPGERGRRRTRSRSPSHSSWVPNNARSTSTTKHGSRPARLSKSRSRSPDRMDTSDDRNGPPRGRWGASPPPTRSLGPSRAERSPSPYSTRRAPSPYRGRNGYGGRPGGGAGHGNMGSMRDHHGGGFGARSRFDDGPEDRNTRNGPPPAQPPPVQRERSLSPFSKRVALTKAMNAGHL